MKKLLLILLIIPMLASAQLSKVAEIYSGPGKDFSNPGNFTELNGDVIFTARDGIYGYELWISDGTENGTVLLKDIVTGPGSTWNGSRGPANVPMVQLGDFLYFAANDGVHGLELWKTDGTEEGTVLAADINDGGSSSPASLTVMNGNLYFAADDGINGLELWQYDGTEATLAGDILPGEIAPGTPASSKPVYFTVMKNVLYFSAASSLARNSNELFMYDGTNAPSMVYDINPTMDANSGLPLGSQPQYLTVVGDVLYFSANDATHGNEPWMYDGTNTPRLVEDVRVGTSYAGSNPKHFAGNDTLVFFYASDYGTYRDEVWVYNAKGDSTYVMDLNPTGGSNPNGLQMIDGKLIFTARVSDGTEMHIFDPAVNTMPWNPFDLHTGGLFASTISQPIFYQVDNKLYFAGNSTLSSDSTGMELRYFDWADSTVHLVADINPEPGQGSAVSGLSYINNLFWFSANYQLGKEPFISDGTESGTMILKNIYEGGHANPTNFVEFNNELYFSAADKDHDNELWKTDGTAAGTMLVEDINLAGSSDIYNQITLGDRLIFGAKNDSTSMNVYSYSVANGIELIWYAQSTSTSDGMKYGTGFDAIIYKDYYYFIAELATGERELMRTNGTAAGTDTITSFEENFSNIQYLTVVNDILYFKGKNTRMGGDELWAFDGTNLTMMPEINKANWGGSISRVEMAFYNGELYYQAKYDSTGTSTIADEVGYELYKYNVAEDTSYLFANIQVGTGNGYPAKFTEINGLLVFVADAGYASTRVELYYTDGTTTDTIMDINKTGSSMNTSNTWFEKLNDTTLIFIANDGIHGNELWITDGTHAGTRMVKDINEGGSLNISDNYVVLNDVMYFIANDALWCTDGTEEGTFKVGEMTNGATLPTNYPASGDDNALTLFNGDFYLGAFDVMGTELYKYTPVFKPTTQASAVVANPVTDITAVIAWTNGDATNRVVFVAEGLLEIEATPENLISYEASADWSAPGSILNDTVPFYCVYNGNGSSVELTNLEDSTDYTVYVFEYNGGMYTQLYNSDTTGNYTSFKTKFVQTITFDALAEVTFGDANFDLAATSTSGLDVAFTSNDENVVTISGATVTIVGAGTATITASQAGDATHMPAADVEQTLTVNKADQSITFDAIASVGEGEGTFDLTATASSGLDVTYASSDETVATITGATVTITGPGTTTITASQAGDNNWNAAVDVTQDLVVRPNSINEVLTNEIDLYPSPATTRVKLYLGEHFSADNTVRIMSMTGKTVASYTLSSASEYLNIQDLEAGLYIVNIRIKNQTAIKKLIVE